MKAPIYFKDHVVEYPYRYQEVDVGAGYINHIKAPGEILQQGTPLSATNFNKIDLEALHGVLAAVLVGQHVNQLTQKVEGLAGEQITTTMTNSQAYPFNNSKKTVNLSKIRNTKDYSVIVEVLEWTGGGVGEIRITDKLLNGFKIEYTGAASSVKVNCIVQGGI